MEAPEAEGSASQADAVSTPEPDPSERVSLNVDDLPDADEVPAEAKPSRAATVKPEDATELPRVATAQPVEPLPELPAPSEPAPPVGTSAPTVIGSSAPPSSSGSIDVAVSNAGLPAGASGSVDVALSASAIPQASTAADSQPVSATGGIVAAVAANEGTGPARRTKRVTSAMQDALSGGVEKLGTGIGSIGEGVTKLGDVTRKVPLVGTSVGMLGEGLTKAGESIHALPQVAKTRRGRLLVRSVVVGFLIVFSWITVIVWFQLRSHDTPDFRPEAERILVELGKGRASIAQVYEHASPRFHEIANKERFIDDMSDLYATNGKFREISAITDTLVTTGPTGRVGRVGLTASFENGISRGSISFHWDKGQWKMLGLAIEVPEDLQISQTERQKRIAACLDEKGRDVSDQRRKCDVRDAAETILELIREGRAGEVWDSANPIFKQQESRLRFAQIQEEQRAALGNYKRVLNVTDARAIGGVSATFDVVAEFEKSSGVRVEFDFTRPSKFERWQLARFKVTVPMPRANEVQLDTTSGPLDEAGPTLDDAGVPMPDGS